jgi:adenosine deaminase
MNTNLLKRLIFGFLTGTALLGLPFTQPTFAAAASTQESVKTFWLDDMQKYQMVMTLNGSAVNLKILDQKPTTLPGNLRVNSLLPQGLNIRYANGEPIETKISESLTFEIPKGVNEFYVGVFNRKIVHVATNENKTSAKIRQRSTLTAFDLRQFSKQGMNYARLMPPDVPPELVNKLRSPVDLHTHFGGALTAEDIVNIATKNGASYPKDLLNKLKIDFPKNEGDEKNISLRALSKEGRKKLMAAMSFAPTEVETFGKMEDIYVYRGPLVKHLPSFADFLEALSRDYKKRGVNYALLSISDVLKPEWLNEAHRVLPGLEKKYGVKIRFLPGLWRHSPTQFNLDMLERMKVVLASPYIVGPDYMGHETNSTHAFGEVIKRGTEILQEAGLKHYVNRVHAGENPLYPENVKAAIQYGANQIGHGLYGISPETIELAKEKNVHVEIQELSNLTLNNVTTKDEFPIKVYLANGVQVSQNSDGHGLYLVSPESQIYAALYAGVTLNELEHIHSDSLAYIKEKEGEFQSRLTANPNLKIGEFPEPKFKNQMWDDLANAAKAEREKLQKSLTRAGVKVYATVDEFIKNEVPGMFPILHAGASIGSYRNIDQMKREEIVKMVREQLHHSDPTKNFIMTSGSNYGYEKIVHDEMNVYNEEARRNGKPEYKSLALWVTEDKGLEYEIGKTSHAVIVSNTYYDQLPKALEIVSRLHGIVLITGGGDMMNNGIQAARNIGVDFLLFDGVGGASQKNARLVPQNAFENSAQLLELLKARYPRFLRPEAMALSPGKLLWTHNRKVGAFSTEEAIKAIKAQKRNVVTFGGYVEQGYKDVFSLVRTIQGKLKELDPSKVIISGPPSDKGIGIVHEIAKKMGFKTIGIAQSNNAEPSTFSRFADEIYIVNDKDEMPIDGLSGSSRLKVETSSQYIAIGDDPQTRAEKSAAQRKQIKVSEHNYQANSSAAIDFFVNSMHDRVREALVGRVREYGLTPTNKSLKAIGELVFKGESVSMNHPYIREQIQSLTNNFGNYDQDKLEAAKMVMAAAISEYKKLSQQAVDTFFPGVRRLKTTSTAKTCQAVFGF